MTSSPPGDSPDLQRPIVTVHQALLAELVESVVRGTRLIALTGPAGAGKTTIAAALQQELLSRSVEVSRIDGGSAGRIDLRALTCQLLDKPEADFDADDIEALFDVMTGQGRVLIIDDAELLGSDALGYLRLLFGIAMEEMPQIVLIGGASLWHVLEQHGAIRDLITERRELGEPDAAMPAPTPDTDACAVRRRSRLTPALAAATIVAAVAVAGYWYATVRGGHMEARAGSALQTVAVAPDPSQLPTAAVASLVTLSPLSFDPTGIPDPAAPASLAAPDVSVELPIQAAIEAAPQPMNLASVRTATRVAEAALVAPMVPDIVADVTAPDDADRNVSPMVLAAVVDSHEETLAPAPDITPLVARGNSLLALGDVAAARLFYERAAALGNAQAATLLGKTYDAGFLASIRATGITPDRALAVSWYRKGAALGDAESVRRLAVLTANR